MLDLFAALLASPSDFIGDPAGGVGNQAAHAVAVGGGGFLLALAIFLWLPLFERADLAAMQTVPMVYAIWEVWQIALGGGLLDGFTDWAFVTAGVVLWALMWRHFPPRARLLSVALVAAALAYMVTR